MCEVERRKDDMTTCRSGADQTRQKHPPRQAASTHGNDKIGHDVFHQGDMEFGNGNSRDVAIVEDFVAKVSICHVFIYVLSGPIIATTSERPTAVQSSRTAPQPDANFRIDLREMHNFCNSLGRLLKSISDHDGGTFVECLLRQSPCGRALPDVLLLAPLCHACGSAQCLQDASNPPR
jgi:hypothetical protein